MNHAVQAHMKLGTTEAIGRAWHLVKLMDTDYCDKMVVSLLKIELLSIAEHVDEAEYYNGKRMIDIDIFTDQRSSRSNDSNHRTQRHHLQDTHTSHTQVEGS